MYFSEVMKGLFIFVITLCKDGRVDESIHTFLIQMQPGQNEGLKINTSSKQIISHLRAFVCPINS